MVRPAADDMAAELPALQQSPNYLARRHPIVLGIAAKVWQVGLGELGEFGHARNPWNNGPVGGRMSGSAMRHSSLMRFLAIAA
jgi:hypothetical protein